MAAMAALAVIGVLAALASTLAVSLAARRRERAFQAELERLTEQLRELTVRLEAAEGDAAQAITQSGIAESLLLEKGLADEEDVEAMRQRFDQEPPPGHDREGELH